MKVTFQPRNSLSLDRLICETIPVEYSKFSSWGASSWKGSPNHTRVIVSTSWVTLTKRSGTSSNAGRAQLYKNQLEKLEKWYGFFLGYEHNSKLRTQKFTIVSLSLWAFEAPAQHHRVTGPSPSKAARPAPTHYRCFAPRYLQSWHDAGECPRCTIHPCFWPWPFWIRTATSIQDGALNLEADLFSSNCRCFHQKPIRWPSFSTNYPGALVNSSCLPYLALGKLKVQCPFQQQVYHESQLIRSSAKIE